MIENWSGRNAGKGRAGRGGPEEDGREPQLRGVTSRDCPNRARGFQPGAIVPRADSPGSSRVRRESSCGQSFTWCRHGGAAAGVRLIREQWPRRQEELQPTRVIRYLSAESAGGALEKQHRGKSAGSRVAVLHGRAAAVQAGRHSATSLCGCLVRCRRTASSGQSAERSILINGRRF